jgi:hypothetical protein
VVPRREYVPPMVKSSKPVSPRPWQSAELVLSAECRQNEKSLPRISLSFGQDVAEWPSDIPTKNPRASGYKRGKTSSLRQMRLNLGDPDPANKEPISCFRGSHRQRTPGGLLNTEWCSIVRTFEGRIRHR